MLLIPLLPKIIITDNGKGISESIKQKIFDHLFTTKSVGKGTGLGLANARQIIEETHNGKLSFNTVIGEGTEFIIEIPLEIFALLVNNFRYLGILNLEILRMRAIWLGL